MIQTHKQLLLTSEEYNTLFSKNEFYPIQKAYSTPHFLVLGLRFPGQNVVLYIGRGNQYEGIFIANKFPPSYLRVQDRLLDYVRKYLVGTRLGKMEIDTKYFLALFHFKNDHTDNSFSFGYKDRQLFFIKQSKEEVYTSWNGETATNKTIVALVDHFMGTTDLSGGEINSTWTLEDYFIQEQKKITGKPLQKKKEKFLDKKLNNISNDLNGVKKWREIEKDLLSEEKQLDLNGQEIILHSHKIKFNSALTLWQRRDLVFGKIKKLRRAEDILQERLLQTREEYSKVKAGEFDFEVTKEKIIAPLWKAALSNKVKGSGEFRIKNFRIKNFLGVIALDAESNDWLRSQGAKDHYWFHIENYPGAHCILKSDSLNNLTGEDLSAIGSLLRDHSSLEIMEIPIIYSQLKNVKGLKGAQGKVLIKKPRYLRCHYVDWKEIITVER